MGVLWKGKVTFPNLEIAPGGSLVGPNVVPYGNVFYVDSVLGSAANRGKSWATAKKTITTALALCSAGDTIVIKGKGSSTSATTNRSGSFNEAVSCSLNGIKFIGVGPVGNEAIWSAPDTTAPCLTITGTDCLVYGIRFAPPVANAAISLSGAYQTRIENCHFQGKTGSYYGILTDGNNANVQVINNIFAYINTATYATAIKGSGYSVGENSGWIVQGNTFQSNLNHIVCRMRQSFIINNFFAAGGLAANNADSATLTVLGIDLHGATGGCNIVTGNFLGSLYHQACYYGGTDDSWSGNFCTDRSHATPYVDATTGISITAPAT
jgi:hypothetical protein